MNLSIVNISHNFVHENSTINIHFPKFISKLNSLFKITTYNIRPRTFRSISFLFTNSLPQIQVVQILLDIQSRTSGNCRKNSRVELKFLSSHRPCTNMQVSNYSLLYFTECSHFGAFAWIFLLLWFSFTDKVGPVSVILRRSSKAEDSFSHKKIFS